MADFKCWWHDGDRAQDERTIDTLYASKAAEDYVEDLDWQYPKPMNEQDDPLVVFVRDPSEKVERFSVSAVEVIEWRAEPAEDEDESAPAAREETER